MSVHAGNSTFSFTALNKLKKKCQPADINPMRMDLILFCGPISNYLLFSIGLVITISKSMQTVSYMSHVCAFLYVSADPVAIAELMWVKRGRRHNGSNWYLGQSL